MRASIIFVFLLWCSILIGCRSQSAAANEDRSASSQESEYQSTSMVTLAFAKDVKVVATIETLKDSIQAVAGKKPRAKLLITNLSTNRVLREQECGDSTLSNPGFWIEKGAALVMTTKGGSGDGIAVYEVTESDARIVLAESYRAAAITMPNDDLGGDMGFLIIDSESGTSPLIVRRYQYDDRNKKYVLTGQAPFAELNHSVKAQFERAAK
jgi:hypothetical protein